MFSKLFLQFFNNSVGVSPFDSWVPDVPACRVLHMVCGFQTLQHFHNFCMSLYSHLYRGRLCKISTILVAAHKIIKIAKVLRGPPLVPVPYKMSY
jgi:hypothetical protein